ncbi:dihydrofolate reductase [Bythopirellula polymerisocia]|uniref:Dihydrofolate reductase n=1 Tax=Bythopirellula polymerisocia TaxID=2528003 RepID=A0A5C6D679_9BACT|nr:dihydrofolate reductase [Bythopirellula polymerisocia]TWU30379.1 Dihydrofolate reductase type 3 [Bythopirellula polymerisocia]
MKIAILVAVSENGIIGREGKLPWHMSADLRRFRRITMEHAILMGRKTWESIGRPLHGRTSIVISHNKDYDTGHSEVKVAGDLDEALAIARQADCDQDQAFVIGGAAIYELALPQADRLYFTRVLADVEGDVSFPEVNWSEWEVKEESHHTADEFDEYDHTFSVYQRV